MNLAARIRQERQRRHLSQEALAEALGTAARTISRWERGQSIPQAYYRLRLCRLFDLHPDELSGEPADQQPQAPVSPPTWHVPYRRNPFFTGREEVLHALHQHLTSGQPLALTRSPAISGPGGIGKTQLALEYAYRSRQDYRHVFWINATTRELLLAGLTDLAARLHLPVPGAIDPREMVQAARQWLAVQAGWLLILDNADDLAMVADVLPAQCAGHLLLTTRAQALGSLARRMDIDTMGIAEGTLFLLRRANVLAADEDLDRASSDQLSAAEAIAIELDFLPLALDQAGAYIDEVGCGLWSYLDLYRMHRKELLARRGSSSYDHPESVATTWSLNFSQVQQTNPAAAALLRLCAFLAPDAIPEEIFSEGGSVLGPLLQPCTRDAFTLNEAIEAVRRFSLIQRTGESRLLRIHRLLQDVLKDALGEEEQRQQAECAVLATSLVFPAHVEVVDWQRCQRFLPQAQRCASLIEDCGFTCEPAGTLLFRTARYLYSYALYEQAESLHLRALRIREQVCGPDHPAVADSLYHLAQLYQKQGQYEQAEPVYLRALRIREQACGPDHPDVAASLLRVGMVSMHLGKYQQAEPLYLLARQIWEQLPGPTHPDLADVFDALGILYFHQEHYEQAESCYQQALSIRTQAFGPEDARVAPVLNNLGLLYVQQHKGEQAEPLLQRALQIWRRTLPPHHLYLAYPLAALGDLALQQQRDAQAETLFLQALAIWAHLQEQHPDAAGSLESLATLRERQGREQEAASLYRQALAIRERALGAQHPQTTDTRQRLHALRAEDRQ